MSTSRIKIINLLTRMFPGNADDRMPGFNELFEQIELWLDGYEIEALDQLLSLCNSEGDAADVNELIKRMRRENPDLINRFLIQAIEVYFSNSKVISILKNGETTLFPHQKLLPNIDFDLLIPVLELDNQVGE
ncbi:MAG: hypothetical protein P8176_16500 [Gammaproteobacteria bacterium]